MMQQFRMTGSFSLTCHLLRERDSFLVERRTWDGKVASLNLGRSGRKIFFSRVNFVC